MPPPAGHRFGHPFSHPISTLWIALTRASAVEPDEARREHLVKGILVTTCATLAVFTVPFAGAFAFGILSRADIVTVALVDLFAGLSFGLMRLGRWKIGAWIMSLLFFLLPTFLTYVSGAWTPIPVYFSLSLVLALTLLGNRCQWATLGLCVAAYLAAGAAHGGQGLEDLFGNAVSVGAPLTGILLLVRFSSRQLTDALVTSRTTADGLAREMAERREAEMALVESVAKIRALFESIPDGISVMDLEGKLVDYNATSIRLYGVADHREALGMSGLDFVTEKDRPVAAADLARVRSGEVLTALTRYRMKAFTGHEFEAQISGVLLRNAAGTPTGILVTTRDISKQVELETQLRQAQKMEAVGQLAGGVAHDFNNLLLAIQGYTELALGDLDPVHAARQHLEEVIRASDRAGALVRQLLSFSRSDASQPLVLDLNDVVRGLLSMLSRLIGEHVTLGLELAGDLGGVKADPRQLEQVLVNLCVNARDAMPEGGRIQIETADVTYDAGFVGRHPWAAHGAFVLLRVSDSGTGMSADVKAHLFEPFYTTKRPGKGTGMGLATVYSIVQQHGGRILCESEPGLGTTFTIYLPSDGSRSPSKIDEAPPASALPKGGDETILLAEDDEQVRRLAARILGQSGYRVIIARDGDEAVRVFGEHLEEIDLALIDVVMPGMNGRAVSEHIGRHKPSLPVLFSSGYDFHMLDDALEGGSYRDIVRKPYRPQELLRRVRQALDAI